MRLKLFGFLSLALLGISSAAGCARSDQWVPVRPQGMPDRAEFIGGPDGGFWMHCGFSDAISMECEVFSPESGELAQRMFLRVCLDGLSTTHFDAPRISMMDARGVRLEEVWMVRTRPDEVYFDTSWVSEAAAEVVYSTFGIRDECRPVAAEVED